MKVGLISDTHGVFSKEFREFLKDVDVIWHAGDFGAGIDFIEDIRSFKPLVGVWGNCDGQDLRREFPEFQLLKVQGLSILITHIGGSPDRYYPRAKQLLDEYRPDVFICGHSHILKVMRDHKRDLLYVNPGAAGLQGWQVSRTALRFKIEDGALKDMEVFDLPR